MIVISNGLQAITTKPQYQYLCKFMSNSFCTHPHNIISSMENMKQYFYFRNNRPVASVSYRELGDVHCKRYLHHNVLYNIATSDTYRRKGIMMRLLHSIIHDLKAKGKRHINLEVLKSNVPAVRLYHKLGFRVIASCNNILLMRIRL